MMMKTVLHIGGLLLLQACSSVEPTVSRSTPVSSSKQVGTVNVGEVLVKPDLKVSEVWSVGKVSLPEKLRIFTFGMDAMMVRLGAEQVRDQEIPLFELDAEAADMVGGQLLGSKGFGFTLIIRDQGLQEIDVSMPKDEAREELEALWGKASLGSVDGVEQVFWVNPELGVKAVLFLSDEDRAVVKFSEYAIK
jgi:hypothetical protein